MIFSKFRKRLGLYGLRKEGANWVKQNLGVEWVGEFYEKYDKINQGVPIGNLAETIVFLDMVERIKQEI